MSSLALKFIRQIDDGYSFEGTLSDAYAASCAENLRYDRFVLFELDGFNVASYLGTESEACSVAPLWSALGPVDDGNSDFGSPLPAF